MRVLRCRFRPLPFNNRLFKVIVMVGMLHLGFDVGAHQCPDPATSDLAYGKIPEPWELNPFSQNRPHADPNTQFYKANILVAGLGHGVSCTYENYQGKFSIWWPVRTRIPSVLDLFWVATVGGFVCSESLQDCSFQIATE